MNQFQPSTGYGNFPQGGPRREGDKSETGYCCVHNKRRARYDLVDSTEFPGQLRCNPSRQCFLVPTNNTNDPNWCTCKIHGKRRNVRDMKLVGPDEYECLPQHLCRLGNPGMPSGMMGGRSGPFPNNSNTMIGGQPGSSPNFMTGGFSSRGFIGNSGTALTPTGPTSVQGMFGALVQNQFQMNFHANHEHMMSEVWCAKHGKKIGKESADVIDEVIFVCRDATSCLAVHLEDPRRLRDMGCTELLCKTHHVLRSAKYLAKSSDDQGFECSAKHPCLARDVHLQGAAITAVGDTESSPRAHGASAVFEAYSESTGVEGTAYQYGQQGQQQAYPQQPSDSTGHWTNFHPQTTASSFFS